MDCVHVLVERHKRARQKRADVSALSKERRTKGRCYKSAKDERAQGQWRQDIWICIKTSRSLALKKIFFSYFTYFFM